MRRTTCSWQGGGESEQKEWDDGKRVESKMTKGWLSPKTRGWPLPKSTWEGAGRQIGERWRPLRPARGCCRPDHAGWGEIWFWPSTNIFLRAIGWKSFLKNVNVRWYNAIVFLLSWIENGLFAHWKGKAQHRNNFLTLSEPLPSCQCGRSSAGFSSPSPRTTMWRARWGTLKICHPSWFPSSSFLLTGCFCPDLWRSEPGLQRAFSRGRPKARERLS